MAKKIEKIPKDNNIIRIPIEEAMPENYLPYAVEVAKERALPDVRDGLKPVHRRIIYGAYMLRAFPDRPYYKSARIVGDILGKYHPHGDASVYDSMVILAQNFTTRNPLIDGHGNWGSIDGDSAAAMRYTEARLTPIALEMIRDIDKDVVNMVPNYSETEDEPSVLPSRYPNILVNGAFGIAVGLATNIPPHNLREVIEALLHYIDNKDMTTKELMNYVKGPDLPTGGILIGRKSMLNAYESGEGKVTLRAKTSIEKLETGRLGIVITEFPYRKNKAKLLQSISEMTGDKKHSKALEGIMDIRDESDRNGIRAVIEFKKSIDYDVADKVLKYLYKKTDLQSNINFNMVALADGKPQTMGLKTILYHYLNHQKEIVTRRTQKELDIAAKRFHIVEGFIKAIDILDAIIETIRASKSKKDAGENLVSKFGFTEIQAEAILELMLYRLTGLEIKVFEKEYKELEKLIAKLKKVLGNEKELLKVIKNELQEISDKYGDDRRTEIVEDDAEAKIDIEEILVVEDIIVTLSKEGYIKRVPLKSYTRSVTNVEDIEYREGDSIKQLFSSNTRDTIMFFTSSGNMYQVKGIDIPEYKWKEKGEKLDNIIRGLNLENENIVAAYSVPAAESKESFVFVTSAGLVKKTSLDKFATNYSKIMALKLRDGEKLIFTEKISSERKDISINCTTEKGLVFAVKCSGLENSDRSVLGISAAVLGDMDKIVSVEITDKESNNHFKIGLSSSGDIRILKDGRSKAEFEISTNSKEELLILTNKGIAYKLPAYLFENVEGSIKLGELLQGFSENDAKILEAAAVKEYSDKYYMMFMTKNGMIKKTSLKDFEGAYINTQAYKFKGEDELVAIKLSSAENHSVIMVTKKAMCIRFDAEAVSIMGKVASGVTGISLKEDDAVVYSDVMGNSALEKGIIKLTSSKSIEKDVNLSEIRLQNRAGRGNSIVLIVFDDYIKDVKIV